VRERRSRRLHAYLDGELGERAARRAAAWLEGSADARAELEGARRVGEQVRRSAAAPGPAPDLWDAIARRLPAIDAERVEAAPPGRTRPRFLAPLLASGAAAVALVVALLLQGEPVSGDVVQWLDTDGSPVMVLDSADDTIIWVLDPTGDDVSLEGRRASA